MSAWSGGQPSISNDMATSPNEYWHRCPRWPQVSRRSLGRPSCKLVRVRCKSTRALRQACLAVRGSHKRSKRNACNQALPVPPANSPSRFQHGRATAGHLLPLEFDVSPLLSHPRGEFVVARTGDDSIRVFRWRPRCRSVRAAAGRVHHTLSCPSSSLLP